MPTDTSTKRPTDLSTPQRIAQLHQLVGRLHAMIADLSKRVEALEKGAKQ